MPDIDEVGPAEPTDEPFALCSHCQGPLYTWELVSAGLDDQGAWVYAHRFRPDCERTRAAREAFLASCGIASDTGKEER